MPGSDEEFDRRFVVELFLRMELVGIKLNAPRLGIRCRVLESERNEFCISKKSKSGVEGVDLCTDPAHLRPQPLWPQYPTA